MSTIIIGHLYVLAVEVKINDFKYELDISTKTAKVLPGDSAYFGNLVIPDTIEHEGILYIVTAIGKKTFQDCKELFSIVIPNTVTTLDDYAFYRCI